MSIMQNFFMVANYLNSIFKTATAGFDIAGYNSSGTRIATAEKLTYANDTRAFSTTANLAAAKIFLAAATDTKTKGIWVGGRTSALVATAEKVSFSNDTRSAIAAVLSVARGDFTGSGNPDKGYFCGGTNNPALASPTGTPIYYATADKITWSTETIVATVSANLSTARMGVSGAGNTTKTFFCGGYTWAVNSEVTLAERIDYSNDTRTVIAGAALSYDRGSINALSNSTNAYFLSGGYMVNTMTAYDPNTGAAYFQNIANPVLDCDKISLSTETRTTLTNSTFKRVYAGMTGSLTAGYVSGGKNSGAFNASAIVTSNKLDYATDTILATTNLGTARNVHAGA